MLVGSINGYPIYLSNKKNKKYMALIDNKFIHFGDSRYQQFHDKLKMFSDLDHHDPERLVKYYKRHGPATPNTAKWLSHNILW